MVYTALMLLGAALYNQQWIKLIWSEDDELTKINKRSYPVKLIVWTCNHSARCNGHISWTRAGWEWRRFVWVASVNDHSNGLFVDARNETNIDSKSSFG